MNVKELYEPDGTHENFNVYAQKPEPKQKQLYRYINKNGEKVGQYLSILPERSAKKILRQIYKKTGIPNPVYHIYNEDTRTLYKYAGQVSNAPARLKKLAVVNIDNKIYKIPVKYKYVVRQIEYRKIID
ncbi:hypothetical protein EKK58_04340 [Candidatus Dependentiae bacterium]|nr:MAG: hypothetical protein EKK58_04340 [Candidatus Dependentiae bacterium]